MHTKHKKKSNPYFKYLDEPTEEEKMVSKSNDYLSSSFNSNLPYQMVDTKELWQFREFDRRLIPKVEDNGERLEQIKRYV